MVSKVTEERTSGAPIDYGKLLADFTLPPSLSGEGMAESAVAIDWSKAENAAAFAEANAGPALVVNKQTVEEQERDPAFEAARDGAIRDIQAQGATAGLTADEISKIVESIGKAKSMAELMSILTTEGFNAIATGTGDKARALVDAMHDAAEARANLELLERERQRMYNDWFNGDQEAVRRMMEYDRIAIYSDDPEAVRRANDAADRMIDAAPNLTDEERDRAKADRRARVDGARDAAQSLPPEERRARLSQASQDVGSSLAEASQRETDMNAALLAQTGETAVETTTPVIVSNNSATSDHPQSAGLAQAGVTLDPQEDGTPEPEPMAARPVVVAAAPSVFDLA